MEEQIVFLRSKDGEVILLVGEAAYKYGTMNKEKDTPKLTDGNPLAGEKS